MIEVRSENSEITMKVIKIAIIGSTGGVGREIIHLLNNGFFYNELCESPAVNDLSRSSMDKVFTYDGDTFSNCSERFGIEEYSSINFELSFEVTLVASENSSGLCVKVLNENVLIKGINEFMSEIENGNHYDVIFSCASFEISEKYVTKMLNNANLIIDKTEYFRKKAPLVIPELNGYVVSQDMQDEMSSINDSRDKFIDEDCVHGEKSEKKDAKNSSMSMGCSQSAKVVSSPNCVAIPLIMLLYPVKDFIKRVVVSTYQSISGAGINAVNSFYQQTQDLLPYLHNYSKNNHSGEETFEKNFAFNAIPQIGEVNENGLTSEEQKIVEETQLFLGKRIPISVTSVRIPTIVGHGMSVNIEFCNFSKKPYLDKFVYDIEDVNSTFLNVKAFLKSHLNRQKGVVVCDENDYMTTIESVNRSQIFVSRMRLDGTQKNTVSMWVVCDNMRKGAALNSAQIACEFLKNRRNNKRL